MELPHDFECECSECLSEARKRREEVKKKPVSSSHLALRFYKHAGWTLDILNQYLVRGRFTDQHGDQEPRDYYWLDHEQGSAADMERLLNEQISEVIRWYDGPPRETDLEYLKKMNW